MEFKDNDEIGEFFKDSKHESLESKNPMVMLEKVTRKTGKSYLVKQSIVRSPELKEADHQLSNLINLHKRFLKLNLKNVIRCQKYKIITLEDRRQYMLIFPFFKNRDLDAYVSKRCGLFEFEARNCFIEMIKGLKELHDLNIAHLDVKPSNFLFTDDMSCLILMDIECFSDKRMIKEHFSVTPLFAPPETEEKFIYYHDPKASDIYSLGVSLLSILTLRVLSSGFHNNLIFKFKDIVKAYPFKYFSSDLSDLLEKMTRFSWKERITIDDVFNHPWVKKELKVKNLELKKNFSKVSKENVFKYLFDNYKIIKEDKDFLRMVCQKIDNDYNFDEVIESLSLKGENSFPEIVEKEKIEIKNEYLKKRESFFFKSIGIGMAGYVIYHLLLKK